MAAAQKDPSTAFLIELVGGLFGFLGLGYMYVGRTNDGVIRLIVFLVYNIIAWVAIAALTVVVVGCVCIPVQLAIQLGVAIFSAYQLKTSLTTGAPMAPAFAPRTPATPAPTAPPMPPAFSTQTPAPSVPQPTVTPPPAPPTAQELPTSAPRSSREWPPAAPLPLEDAPREPTPPPTEEMPAQATPLPADKMPAQPPPAEDMSAQPTPPDADKPVDPTA